MSSNSSGQSSSLRRLKKVKGCRRHQDGAVLVAAAAAHVTTVGEHAGCGRGYCGVGTTEYGLLLLWG